MLEGGGADGIRAVQGRWRADDIQVTQGAVGRRRDPSIQGRLAAPAGRRGYFLELDPRMPSGQES